MRRLFLILLSILLSAGCATRPSRKGMLSRELPLTVDDLAEIRAGEKNQEKVMWEYRQYLNPRLEKYLNAMATNLAAVSTRPHLPYHVILLDHEEVNIFGGPGGFIYITHGLLNYVQSEAELAGVMAHEITHVANYEYANIPHISKIKFAYDKLLKGSELAKGAIGTYGTALNYGLKGLGTAAPFIARRYGKDQEVETDLHTVDTLVKAGYDPREYLKLVERLSRVPMEDISRFVVFMNAHPPFQERRDLLKNRILQLSLEDGKIEFKADAFGEMREMAIGGADSIVYEPQFGTRQAAPLDMDQMNQTKSQEFSARNSKRWSFS